MTSTTHETGCPVLGGRVKAARRALQNRDYWNRSKWSQAGVAKALGVSRATVAQIERGGRSPSLQLWAALAELLGIDRDAGVEFFTQHHRLGRHVRARRDDGLSGEIERAAFGRLDR